MMALDYTERDEYYFPFSAIVGHANLKRLLVLTLINKNIRSLLIFGESGTGKTTLIRALKNIMGETQVITTCRFNCSSRWSEKNLCPECQEKKRLKMIETSSLNAPFIEITPNIRIEALTGMIRINKDATFSYSPGLLASANQGIIFAEKIDLFDTEIIDELLAITHRKKNIVMELGEVYEHPVDVQLIFSHDGDSIDSLPDRIRDRFQIIYATEPVKDIEERIAIVKRYTEFKRDAVEFCSRFRNEEKQLRTRISRASKIIGDIIIPDKIESKAGAMLSELKLKEKKDVFLELASANAAFNERKIVVGEDLTETIMFVRR